MRTLVLCIFLLLAIENVYAADSELQAYIKSCKKILLEASPGKDPKDVDMLCRDPYLKGKPNESKEDKARRTRLLGETDKAKEAVIGKEMSSKGVKSNDFKANSKEPDLMSEAEYLKECKKMIKEQDPGKDPKDVDMLCSDPYLKGKAGESYEDQVRRKRLIKESERAKEKAMEKYVPATPAASEPVR